MDKVEMIVALTHCLSMQDVELGRNCSGCPFEDTSGCMYDLKMAVIKELLDKQILVPSVDELPNTINAWLGGETNA